MVQTRTMRQVTTAVGTFAVALGIGFFMQYGDAVASRWGSDAPVTGPQSRSETAIPVVANMAVSTKLTVPQNRITEAQTVAYRAEDDSLDVPALIVPTPADPAPVAAEAPAPVAETPAPIADAAPDCTTYMTATPATLAMVDLAILNLCRPAAVIAVHHQGMMFNLIANDVGAADVTVPALAKEAFFIAAYDDGEGAVAMTGVPDLAAFDRAALQWQGEDDVQLHALEFGASYGAAGHVWSGAMADPAVAVAGTGGFLTKLGDPRVSEGLMAEVYTFPSGTSAQDGAVALSVEAEITARNCGRKVEAQSIQVIGGAEPTATDMVMTMPECDAVGEYLVLKNMFEDLTLAAR